MLKKIRGITIVEVMVTLSITTIGLLGLTSMQLHTMRSVQDSGNRALAIWVVNDLVNRIRSNERDESDNLVDHTTDEVDCGDFPQTITICSPYHNGQEVVDAESDCSANQMAIFDRWEALCGMPLATGVNARMGAAGFLSNPSLSVAATSVDQELTITLSWDSKTASTDENGNPIYLVDENNLSANQRSSYSMTFIP